MAEKTKDICIENRQARFRYFILETFEAGIELKGSEVKSIRQGGIQLKEGFAHVHNHEVLLEGIHISPYEHSGSPDINPIRTRRLLLHRKQIDQIETELSQQGLTLVPLKVYFKNGRIKLALGIGKGKKFHDKRTSIKEREIKRTLERVNRRSSSSRKG